MLFIIDIVFQISLVTCLSGGGREFDSYSIHFILQFSNNLTLKSFEIQRKCTVCNDTSQVLFHFWHRENPLKHGIVSNIVATNIACATLFTLVSIFVSVTLMFTKFLWLFSNFSNYNNFKGITNILRS